MSRLRIEIFPDHLDETVTFYTDVLGFSATRDEHTATSGYVALRLGDARVGAAQRPALDVEHRRPPTGVELVVEVENLMLVRQRVRDSGWPLEEDLTTRPCGLTDFHVLDPFGYYRRITQQAATLTEDGGRS